MKKMLKSLFGVVMAVAMLVQAGGNLVFAETTASTADYYSVDLAEGQLFGDTTTKWTAKWGNGMTPTLDSNVSFDGGTSVRLNNPIGNDGNPVAKAWTYKADIDAVKYGIKSGDALFVSGWMKMSEVNTGATNGAIYWTIKYTNVDGTTHEVSDYFRFSKFQAKETTEWQFVSDTLTIPTSGKNAESTGLPTNYVPADATINTIELIGMYNVGSAIQVGDGIWYDRWTVKRANPNEFKTTIIPSTSSDEVGATDMINVAENTTGELTQEQVAKGSNAYKFNVKTGTTSASGKLLGKSVYGMNKTYATNNMNFRTSFWIKLSPEYLAAYPSPAVTIFNNVYYASDANNIPASGWEFYHAPGYGVTLKATTDWQYVDLLVPWKMAEDKVNGQTVMDPSNPSEPFVYKGTPIYIKESRVEVRLQAWNSTMNIPAEAGAVIYADDLKYNIYEDTNALASKYDTKFMGISDINKGGKAGKRVLFNDRLITEGEVAKATIKVNGQVCTDYEFEVLEDNAGFDIYPNVNRIEKFRIMSMTNALGQAIEFPIPTDNWYTEDLADGQLDGTTTTKWSAKWGNGFTPTLDTEVDFNGDGTSVRLNNPIGNDGNPVAKAWTYKADIDAVEYGIKPGDALYVSGWMKYGDTIPTERNNGIYWTIKYTDAEGNAQEVSNNFRNANYFLTEATTDWQFVDEVFTIPTSGTDNASTGLPTNYVPVGSTINSIEFVGMFNQGFAIQAGSGIWFDQWKVQRANTAVMNRLPVGTWDEEVGATNFINTTSGFTTAEITTEEVKFGTAAYKFAGSGAYTLTGGSYQYRQRFESPTVNLKTSFWIKLPQEYIDAYGAKATSMFLYYKVYYAQDADNIPSGGYSDYVVVNVPVSIKATTDWQYVDSSYVNTFTQSEANLGKAIYLLQVRPELRLGSWDAGTITIPEGTAVYMDNLRFTFAPSASDIALYTTKLVSLTAVEKDGKKGVRAIFDTNTIADSNVANATYIVNGEVCTDYTYDMISNIGFDIYPNVETLTSLKIEDMYAYWGNSIATTAEYIAEVEPEIEVLDSVSITSVSATDAALRFVTTATLKDGVEIATFGTTLIPLWLFEDASAQAAVAEYDNANYDIQDGQTYDATLTGIPESCKDLQIVAKSYLNRLNDEYIWSNAKSASVNEANLADVAE